MNSPVAFRMFAVLCPLCLLPTHSHHPQRKPRVHQGVAPHSSIFPSPWKQPVCILSLWIYFFRVSHINGITWYLSFCIHCLLLIVVIQGSLASQCVPLLHTLAWIVFFHIHVYIYYNLFIHSLIDWYLDCFHILAVVNVAAMNTHVHVFVWALIFNSFGYIPRNENGGNSMLIFWGITKLFSTGAEPFYIPISHVRGLQFLYFLISICYILYFW